MPTYNTQSTANKKTGQKNNTKGTNVNANKTFDPTVEPGTPAADFSRGFGTRGTIVTTAGTADDWAWRINETRRASGGVIVRAGNTTENGPGVDGKLNLNRTMQVIGTLTYDETRSTDTREQYTYVNQSVKIKGVDGKYLYYKGYYVPKTKTTNTRKVYSADKVKEAEPSLNKYQWNLPPHKWSMPVLPSADPNFMPASYSRPPVQDRYRRGRIWWAANDPNLSIVQNKTETAILNENNRRFGFQFLWNPQEYRTEIAVQLDAVPMAADRFIGGPGAYPATESVGLTLRLDRTNDFAHAAANFSRPTLIMPETVFVDVKGRSADSAERITAAAAAAANAAVNQGANYVTKDMVKQFVPYYRAQGSFAATDTDAAIQEKLVDLFQRGTMADLEYLYRATNGLGSGASKDGKLMAWTNSRGVMTADIGYLIPTLLYIDIGPASYKGYITSLQIQHGAFTQDMIPIRTDVTISFQIVASSGLTSNYVKSQGGNE